MARIKAFEYKFQGGSELKVDRENGIIRGVHLCGIKSLNGYGYTPRALKAAVKEGKYNGVPIWDLHPTDEELETGDVRRGLLQKAGVTENAVFKDGSGVWGDVKVNMGAGDLAESMLWNAENDPKNFGMSHEAYVDEPTKQPGLEGVWTDHLEQILAIAVVPDPATTQGFFESNRKKKNWFVISSEEDKKTKEGKPMAKLTIEELKKDGIYADVVASVKESILKDQAEGKKDKEIAELKAKLQESKDKEAEADFNTDMAALIVEHKLTQAEVDFLKPSLKALETKEARKARVEGFRKFTGAKNDDSGSANTPPRDFFGEANRTNGSSDGKRSAFFEKNMAKPEDRKAFSDALYDCSDLPTA